MNKTLSISLVFFLNMLGYGLLSSFLPIYMKLNGLSVAEVGLAYGMFPLTTVLLAGFIGNLSDKIGRTKLISIGILFYSAFLAFSSFANSLLMFILAYVILGVGNSLFWVSGRSYVLDIGVKALKYYGFSSIIGSVSGAFIGGFLITSFGYTLSFYFAALITFAGFLFSLFQKEVKTEIKPAHKPEKFKITSHILILAAIVIFTMFLVTILTVYLPVYFKELMGLNEAEIGILVAIIASSWALSQLLAGKILEKTTVKIGLSFGYMILGTFTYAFTLIKEFIILVFAGASWSVGRALYDIGSLMYMNKLFLNRKGLGSAITEIFTNVGAFLGSLSGGILLQMLGYTNILTLVSVMMFLGILLAIQIKK